jgi:hypothetical protein
MDTASSFLEVSDREVKKVPLLRGKSVFNLFFENSTRTRTTFEIAATRLSADVVNLDVRTSSTSKGESLLDTIDNLAAMHADMFVVRHAQSGAPYMIASHVGPDINVINAGDGRHAHPTQGLLDMYTIRHFKKDFSNLTVAVVGDILHSRVARSDIHALTTLGVPEVRAIGPLTLLPPAGAWWTATFPTATYATPLAAGSELLGVFRLFNPIPILLESERRYHFSVDELRKEILGRGLSAFLLSNPCNPTGRTIAGSELAAWVATGRALDCAMLVDVFYSHYIWTQPDGIPTSFVSAAAHVEDVDHERPAVHERQIARDVGREIRDVGGKRERVPRHP